MPMGKLRCLQKSLPSGILCRPLSEFMADALYIYYISKLRLNFRKEKVSSEFLLK